MWNIKTAAWTNTFYTATKFNIWATKCQVLGVSTQTESVAIRSKTGKTNKLQHVQHSRLSFGTFTTSECTRSVHSPIPCCSLSQYWRSTWLWVGNDANTKQEVTSAFSPEAVNKTAIFHRVAWVSFPGSAALHKDSTIVFSAEFTTDGVHHFTPDSLNQSSTKSDLWGENRRIYVRAH